MEEETKQNENKTPAEEYLNPETKKFKEGNPGGGRPKETEEQKVIKKAAKQLINEFKEALAEALPLISPVLVKKATEGDLQAIKEINDRVMGKPDQATDITSGGKPLIINVDQSIAIKNEINPKPNNNSERPPQV